MTTKVRKAAAGALALATALTLAACSSESPRPLESGDITKDNLPTVVDVLKTSELSNVDVFEGWVNDYLSGSAENTETSGFDDADCRMTVMLLAGDSIEYKSLEETYGGTYLMFDVDLIENNDTYSVLKDKEKLFTTLFGEMPIPDSGFADAFPDNLKAHGITFTGSKFSVISIVFKTFEDDMAFVGHTGLLIDTRDNSAVDSDYVFVEKIAFNSPYTVTKIKDEKELLKVLSDRPDYMVEEGEPNPLVYKNGEAIGELEVATVPGTETIEE